MKLSVKQEAFVLEFAKTGNAAEAYRNAGYKTNGPNSATSGASRLLMKANVQKRLKELSDEIKNESIADIQEMQSVLTSIIREELDEEKLMTIGEGEGYSRIVSKRQKAALKDRLKAIELLGKMQGAFIDKVEVNGNVPITFVEDLEE